MDKQELKYDVDSLVLMEVQSIPFSADPTLAARLWSYDSSHAVWSVTPLMSKRHYPFSSTTCMYNISFGSRLVTE